MSGPNNAGYLTGCSFEINNFTVAKQQKLKTKGLTSVDLMSLVSPGLVELAATSSPGVSESWSGDVLMRLLIGLPHPKSPKQ